MSLRGILLGVEGMKIFGNNTVFKKKKEEVKFEVIDGGLSDPKPATAGKEPPSDNWLYPMTNATVFLAVKKKGYDLICSQFVVVDHSENCVQLMQEGAPPFWVMPERFSAEMKLVEVLSNGERK